MSSYLILGRPVSTDDPGFPAALAAAHAARHRPLCQCIPDCSDPPEMYVADVGHRHVVKRMPFTGGRHAPDCPSYEPPDDWSGHGQVMGSAIQEDPVSGMTALRLDFALSKSGSRLIDPGVGVAGDSVASDGTRLTLRGLLHYLWDESGLTRWHPGFTGKRNWGTVRRHLLAAAENKVARGDVLRARLYIPEPFFVEQRDAINSRRIARWRQAIAAPGKPQQLMLLIGEVKEIVPARHGYKAVIKHLPDQGFAIDALLYRRLGRRFQAELALWASAESVHLIAIATFGVSEVGIPTIGEMSLMPVTPQWLPVEDAFERQLVERLVAEGRAFIKGLRYNLARDRCLAAATLTDTGESGTPLFVVATGNEGIAVEEGADNLDTSDGLRNWVWQPASAAMPRLPAPAPREPQVSSAHFCAS